MKKRLLSYQPKRSNYGQIIRIFKNIHTGLTQTEVLSYNKPFDVLQTELQDLKRLKQYKNSTLKLTYIH